MNIINTQLSFSSLSTRKSTARIILHHAAAKICDAATIHRWHRQKGWSGIGYHFVVRKNGTIERGRPESKTGAHASGHNYDSIGICFEGNFETETMSRAQLHAGQELIAYLKEKYKIRKIQCHREVGNTSCPGRHFPLAQITNPSSLPDAEKTSSPGAGGSSLPGTIKNTPSGTGTNRPASPQTSGTSASAPLSHTSASASPDKLAVDGYWGRKTTLRLQKIFGTPADGTVSNQHRCYRAQNPGLDSGWEWKDEPTGNSPLIKAIQKRVGAVQDGHIGPQTIKAIQRWQNCAADGSFSSPSLCIRKIQQWCNSQ